MAKCWSYALEPAGGSASPCAQAFGPQIAGRKRPQPIIRSPSSFDCHVCPFMHLYGPYGGAQRLRQELRATWTTTRLQAKRARLRRRWAVFRVSGQAFRAREACHEPIPPVWVAARLFACPRPSHFPPSRALWNQLRTSLTNTIACNCCKITGSAPVLAFRVARRTVGMKRAPGVRRQGCQTPHSCPIPGSQRSWRGIITLQHGNARFVRLLAPSGYPRYPAQTHCNPPELTPRTHTHYNLTRTRTSILTSGVKLRARHKRAVTVPATGPASAEHIYSGHHKPSKPRFSRAVTTNAATEADTPQASPTTQRPSTC